MIFHKGRDSHDYKYGAAAWEECVLASDPKWRAPLIAATMFNLPGAKTKDSDLMIKAREAVKTVSEIRTNGDDRSSRGSGVTSPGRQGARFGVDNRPELIDPSGMGHPHREDSTGIQRPRHHPAWVR